MNNPELDLNIQGEEVLIYNEHPVCFPENELLLWLHTNKREYKSAGITRPGLFTTHNTNLHGVLVLLIIIFEIAATFLTNESGYDNIWLIVGLVVLDFVVAIGFYYFTSSKTTLLKNHELVVRSPQKKVALRIDEKLKKQKIVLWIGHVIIIALAFVKVYFAVSVFLGYFETSLWLIISFYFIAALLHIISTGKWVMALIHGFMMNKAEKKCLNSWGQINGISSPKTRPIDNGNAELVLKEVGRHRVLKGEDGYSFESYGFLTDNELSELISIQKTDEARRVMAIEGVKFQLQQINSLP